MKLFIYYHSLTDIDIPVQRCSFIYHRGAA